MAARVATSLAVLLASSTTSSGDLIRIDEIAELPNTKDASAESPLLDALVIGFFGLHALPDD